MKDEEVDWIIYHIIAGKTACTAGDLAEQTGLSVDTVESSVRRLIRAMLVAQEEGGAIKPLSLHESFLLCESRFTEDCTFVIEGGVIRPRNRGA